MLSWILLDGDHRKPDYGQATRWALQGRRAGRRRVDDARSACSTTTRWASSATSPPPPSGGARRPLLGDADGQAMLGAAHHLGAGVPRDPVAALAWLMRARTARSKFADRFYAACARAARRSSGARPSAAPRCPSTPRRPRHDRRHRRPYRSRQDLAGAAADRRRHRSPQGGEGARHLDRPRLRLSGRARAARSSASSTCPATKALVHNMLAGATGIDFVVLVIAADDGVMPQTREHLAIIDLLGLRARHRRAQQVRSGFADDRLAAVTPRGRASARWHRPRGRGDRSGIGRDRRGARSRFRPPRLDAAAQQRAPASEGRTLPPGRRPLLHARRASARRSPARCCRAPVSVDDRVVVSPSGLEARVRSINAQNRPVEHAARQGRDARSF